MIRSRGPWMGLLLAAVLMGAPALCRGDGLTETRVPSNLSPGFAHLRSVVDNGRSQAFDPDRIDPIVEFVLSAKDPGRCYHAGEADGATSAYHDFVINRSLADFLKLTYNPALPSYLTVPSTVRLSYWSRIEGANQPLPRLWHHLGKLQTPVRIDGVETVVNTPDLFSGAYYAYDLDRTMILLNWRGKTVMLSLSKQRGRSDVGKQGAVIGSDGEWNYIYTGQEGLGRTGLGWVDSYMYDSFSVTVYVEEAGRKRHIRCGIFKWIRAGWAGINVVRTRHIYRGLERFADAFKAIIEARALSDIAGLEQAFGRIGRLSDSALRATAVDYYARLQDRYGAENRICREWYENAFGEDGHLARMTRREMKAVVSIEYLKHKLGKNPLIDVGKLTAAALKR